MCGFFPPFGWIFLEPSDGFTPVGWSLKNGRLVTGLSFCPLATVTLGCLTLRAPLRSGRRSRKRRALDSAETNLPFREEVVARRSFGKGLKPRGLLTNGKLRNSKGPPSISQWHNAQDAVGQERRRFALGGETSPAQPPPPPRMFRARYTEISKKVGL